MLLSILLITFASFPATASPDEEPGPYSDQLWFNVVIPPDAQLQALLTCQKDVGPVPRPTDIDALQEAGFTVVATERIGYTMLLENNRLHPFDSIAFRSAVNRMVDKELKDEMIWGPLMDPVYYYVPSSQPKWLNPDAPLPVYAPMEAIACLMAGDDGIPGTWDDYTPILIDPGLPPIPGNIENWNDPDTGLPLEEFEYMTISPSESPLNFEDAIIIYEDLRSIGLPVVLRPVTFMEIVITLIFPPDDDWQMISGFGVRWDQSPQFLYNFFHSEGGWNLWGVDDPELDFWCEELLLATNQADAEFAADMIQERAVELEPFLPLFMWVTYTAFKDDIIGIVNMKGYGAAAPRNRWTKMLIRKCTGDPQVHWMLSYYIDSLNPLCSQTESASQILYAVEDLLIEKNPYTHEPMPWAAGMPIVEEWETPTGEPGQSITFTLRDDVFWHDGVQVDAADAVFALNLLRFQENLKYLSVWQHIYDVVQLTDLSFVVYYTQPYYWAYEGISEVALLCPEHIWEPWIDSPETGEPLVIEEGAGPMGGDIWVLPGRHHSEWMGWEDAYMEDPQYPGMWLTNLIGCGPFIYHLGGWEPGVGVHIEANRDYFGGRICPADVNLDQVVDMLDAWQVLYRCGASYCTPRWHEEVNGMTGVAADIACPAQWIGSEEIYVIMTHFGHQWGPGIPPCDP